MGFDVPAAAYGRFMGRFSEPLAPAFADLAAVAAGQTALDVGCGPGTLTEVLTGRLGAPAVAARSRRSGAPPTRSTPRSTTRPA